MESMTHVDEHDAGAALLVIDVINDLDFPGARALLRFAKPAAERIAALKARARRSGMPVIYANDNRGRWRSDFREMTARCAAPSSPGAALVELLRPQPSDYFVLKPKQSAFFATPLQLLLEDLGVHTLILTGVATDGCITCSAIDAHLRDFRVFVPRDCVAASTALRNKNALHHLSDSFGCDTTPSAALNLRSVRTRPR